MRIKVQKKKLKPLESESDDNQAVERRDVIFDATPGTDTGYELEIFGILIDN